MTQTRERKPPVEPSDPSRTVQLLVEDAGNRSAISGMLEDRFDVEASQTVTGADLYLIEDHLFAEYRAALREQVEREDPAFCPIVLIRRESTDLRPSGEGSAGSREGVRYDEVVDAPIDPPQLIRRLNSLLVRRQQSLKLMQQVTTLEKREQRLRLFEQGVESTGNGIVMTDSDGTIEYINPALESIVGYTEADVLGESPQILLPEGTGEVFDAEFWRTMKDREEWEGDIIIEGKDSHRLVVNATVTALRDEKNEIQGFVIVLSDITERIQREQDLEDRETELDLLRQILMRYLRHNLRNDLNVIQGNAALLKEDESLSQRQIESAETIIESTEGLIDKSDTARTYSTLLERDAELSAFDLSEITTKAVQTVREDYSDVRFELDVPETCEIHARDGIQRAFEELIDNAARYNDATDPWVRIQVRDNDGALMVIEDNGPGIPDQERESLEKGTETPLTHSQGVGLWLSKWIIEGVDGQLSVELTDTGTRVTADFPPISKVGSTSEEITTLKERERRLQTITDRMTDAIIEVNADWNVTLLDDRAERIFDVEGDAVIGQRFWDVFPDLRDSQFEADVRNVMESRSSTSVEQYGAMADAWLEFNVYPEFGGGLSFYTREVTERKNRERELGEEKEKYSTLVEQSHDGIIVIRDEEIQFANERAADMLAYEHSELLSKSIIDIVAPQDQDRILDRYHRRLDPEKESPASRYDAVFITKDGEHRTVNVSGAKIQFEGDPADLIVLRDITERKERETRLQKTTTRLEALFDNSPDMIDVLDPKGTILEANRRLCEELGYDEDELRGTPIWELDQLVEADDVKTLLSNFGHGERRKFEGRYERRDGSTVPVEVHLLRLNLDGEDRFVAVSRDISERTEREKELKRTRRRFQTLFEKAPEAIALHDNKGNILEVNEQELKNLGYSREELTSMHVSDFEVGLSKDEAEDLWEEMEVGEMRKVEGEHERKDGSTFPVEVWANKIEINGNIRFLAFDRDITERKRRERELETILEGMNDAVFVHGEDGPFKYVNQAAIKRYGYNESELYEMSPRDLDEPDEAEKVPDRIERVRQEGGIVIETEHQLASGESLPVELNTTPITFQGKPAILSIARDITERKERERELERRAAYLEQSSDIISVMDSKGEVKYQSASTERVTNYSPAEVIGDSGFEHVHPDDLEQFEEEFLQFVSQPNTEVQEELRVETKDGDWRWIEVRGVNKLDDPVIDGLLFSSRDITVRKEREEALQRKRDRLDQFASVVSHDLRNPLNVVQGRIDLAQEGCDTEHLDAAAREVKRSLDLIEDMLELARAGQEVSETEPVGVADLADVCWDTVETADAEIRVDFNSKIQADRSRLRQMVENLFRNAIEHGGEDVTVRIGSLPEGFYVEDDGPGIPHDKREKVWKSGYSGSDDGTGFGLAIVKQIVEAHGWDIRNTDGSNGGARFEIVGVEVVAE